MNLAATGLAAVLASAGASQARRRGRRLPAAVRGAAEFADLIGQGGGAGLRADASWQATRNVKLQVQALHQEVDAAVQTAGSRDGDFVTAIMQYRF